MSHPLVAHHKKKPFDIFIARPSMWGNPFEIGRDGSRSEVIQKFADWIHRQPELMVAIPSLHGKVLGCWCAPRPCHGDVLARLANPELEASAEQDTLPFLDE
jgi:hypothetical protein